MLEFLKKFLFDETAFVGLVRAACLGMGSAVATDMVDVSALGIPKAVGVLLIGLGGFVRAGDKNKTEPRP